MDVVCHVLIILLCVQCRQHFLYFLPLPHGQRLLRPMRRAGGRFSPERKDAVC